MTDEKILKERASDLVGTSVQDLQSSLAHYKSESIDDMRVLNFGLQICNRRGEKTKAKMLKSKLRKMLKKALA